MRPVQEDWEGHQEDGHRQVPSTFDNPPQQVVMPYHIHYILVMLLVTVFDVSIQVLPGRNVHEKKTEFRQLRVEEPQPDTLCCSWF